ncbi:TPA: hypothetical protein ACH3X1_001203 [Trebouxia sp. C0004]
MSVRLQVAYACAVYSLSGEATVIEVADSFEWCGGFYSRTDLRGALSVLCTTQRSQRPDFSQNVTLPDQPLSRQQDGQQHDDRSVKEPSSWNAPQGVRCTFSYAESCNRS